MTVAAVALGAVFLLSGALKARDKSWPIAARALGTPSLLIPLVAPVELVLGALLIVGIATRQMALASIGLLAAFTAVLVVAIRSGHKPACACFGSLSAKPVGWASVARNAGLVALAAVAAI